MSEPRDDYREVDGQPDAGPRPDPTGLRPHDRLVIAGWVGLFMALGPGIVALLYLGPPERWTAWEASIAFGIAGLLMCLYAVAGGLLVIRGAQSKPVQGDAVRYFNLLILGPLLAVVTVFLFGPFVVYAYVVVELRRIEPIFLLFFVITVPFWVSQIASLVRHRRKIIPALLAWLDPTE
jgi:hypothetical protein